MNWPWTKPVIKTVVKVMPRQGKWLEADKNAWREFLKTTTGKKLVEHCQHRLFVDHVDACVHDKDAAIHNASMKGANNLLSAQFYLATEDSIQGGELPVNGSQTNAQPDPLESARDHQRV